MKKIHLDQSEIKRLYLEEVKTGREIAKIFNVSITPVFAVLKKMGIVRKNIVIRDIKKYILSRIIIDEKGCWNYKHGLQSNGYARINNKKAHRVSYEVFKNSIPENLTIDHLCGNKICVNPDHLEPVTFKENNRRSNSVSAINARKTHCIHGHKLSGENMKIYNGKRKCLVCLKNRDKNRRYE